MDQYDSLNFQELSEVSGGQARGVRDYKIKPGDTIEKIAKNVGTTPETICKLNGFSSTPKLYPGEYIRVPR